MTGFDAAGRPQARGSGPITGMDRPDDGRRGPDLEAIDFWIFDLDNTLYDVPPLMHAEIDRRMGAFVADFLGVDEAEARRVQNSYFRQFGLTLRGLMLNHGLDPAEYERRMAGLDITEIRPTEGLREALAAIEGRKVIFTNAFASHARAVLDHLSMGAYFESIHDIAAMDYRPKPHIDTYRVLCDRYGFDPARTVMLDDIPHNLEPAAVLGMTTVWRRTDAAWARGVEPGAHIHHATEDLAGWLNGAVGPG